MTKNTRFSPEVRQRAIRMVLESQGEYDSQWAAICSIAPKIGCTPETLRVWVRQHERDGIPPGHCGAECIRAEEKRAGYQSAEVYAGLTQAKCARESVQV